MCKPIIKACLFLVALTLSFMVSATGLGKFTLNSYLGQSLKAEIDLVSVKKEDISSLKVSLASSNIFSLANVDYTEILDTIEFSIQNRANGQPYVGIISSQPVTDPLFSMLIKLDWPTGNLIREYTVYLEPPNEQLQLTLPEMQQATSDSLNIAKSDHSDAKQLDSVIENLISKEESVSNKSISEQRQVEQQLQEETELQEEAELSEPEDLAETVESDPEFGVTTYGPVKNGDTLFRIVQEETIYNVQLNQLLVALYRANHEAFSENNMNRLKTGFILRIPDESEVATISPDVADKEVKIHTANWEAYRQKLATDVTSIVPISEEPEQTVTGEITTIPDINAETAHGFSGGLLRLSKGMEGVEEGSGEDTINIQEKFNIVEDNLIAGEKTLNEANERISLLERDMEENKIAREKELIESNQRIMALEKNIKELHNLLKLKNLTIASAEAQAESILFEASDSPPMVIEKPVKVVHPPVDSEEKEGSNPTIMNWVLWIMILLLIIGLWWKVKQSRTDNNPKSSNTF